MSLEEVLNRASLAAPRFGVGLLSTFAAIGLILSAIGVFSVMARRRSIRMKPAAGVRRHDIT